MKKLGYTQWVRMLGNSLTPPQGLTQKISGWLNMSLVQDLTLFGYNIDKVELKNVYKKYSKNGGG
jgi:hypothetical protein